MLVTSGSADSPKDIVDGSRSFLPRVVSLTAPVCLWLACRGGITTVSRQLLIQYLADLVSNAYAKGDLRFTLSAREAYIHSEALQTANAWVPSRTNLCDTGK